MKKRNISHLLALGCLGLSVLACNIGKGSTPEANSSDPNQVATLAPADNTDLSDSCANLLLPIRVGATWTYNLSSSISDTFTRSIVSADSSGFTDQDVFGTGVTRQGKWNCEQGNLIALNPAEGGSASVTTTNVTVDFQTTELSGVTIPAAVHAGDTWTQTMTLEGIENINGTDIPAKNQFSNTCTAIGGESVTVQAGTFDAMRVDCQTNINITITMSGQDIQNAIEFSSSNWYAENVGLVKTTTSGSGLDSTIELISYNIP
jgi:hypothetical protein